MKADLVHKFCVSTDMKADLVHKFCVAIDTRDSSQVLCVYRYEGWLAGAQTVFDTSKSKLSQANFALGYTTSDFTLHSAV